MTVITFRMQALIALSVLILLAGVSRTMDAQQHLPYPQTAKVNHTDTYFGTSVQDPYRWLEDDNSEATKKWVDQQNLVTHDYLAKIPSRERFAARLRQVLNHPRYSGPFRKGESIFFYKNTGLQNQSVLYIQHGLTGTPEVLIDPNTFSTDGTIRLSSFQPSKDGRYALYGKTAIPGSDWVELHVMEIATRRTLPDTIHWVKFSGGAWRGDGFYYSRYPKPALGMELTAQNRNQKVYYHRLGTSQEQDELVFEDTEHPDRFVFMGATDDERYAILTVYDNTKRGNSVRFRNEFKGEKSFTPLVAEISEDSFSVIDNDGDRFLIDTNRGAPNRKIVVAEAARPAEANWKTIVPERKQPIESVSTAGHRLFATYLKDVTSEVVVFDYLGKKQDAITLPGLGTAYGFSGERDDDYVFYTFTALNVPSTIYRYEIGSRASVVFKSPEVPGFDPSKYESRRVFYRSKDGTRVPMFLVYKKGLVLNGKNPTILYGYGGFNSNVNPEFSDMRLPWLEEGGVYAQANLRGGSEYGETWHEAGMRLNKQNVFDDCIAAAEWLIKNKYTSSRYLALEGASNGGLLVGAVINQRPDLFAAALPEVGVMDMLRYQKFTAGVGWVSDYGSSDDETQFRYLLRYSPLHNIKAGQKYPAVMITTANHDDRVVPAHSFKYAATLQETADPSRPVLIRIETNSGHGSSNLSKAIEEKADAYAFVMASVGK